MTANTNSSDPKENPEDESCCCQSKQECCQQEPESEAIDFKDKYLRLLAENENLRRRLQKESQDSIKYAVQKVILEFLDPYDSFEKALYHAGYSPSEEVRNWAIGFKMIHQQFKDWLGSQGVHSFVSEKQQFNPQLHEAVEVIESREVRDGYILKELTKGYKIHDRVLRPSKVAIAKYSDPVDELLKAAESDESPEETQKPTSQV
jgi:molecular chaperone GrpE